jgi:hypothetical protein
MTLTWDQATNRPPYPTKKLRRAWAYLRNDQPNGFGVGLGDDADEEGLEAALKNVFTVFKNGWDRMDSAEREGLLDEYMHDAEAIASTSANKKKNMPIPERVELIVSMMWLTASGRVKNDEYNGTLFLWDKE